jgi:hypothetical protein
MATDPLLLPRGGGSHCAAVDERVVASRWCDARRPERGIVTGYEIGPDETSRRRDR